MSSIGCWKRWKAAPAVLPITPVRDTIKRVQNGIVQDTVDRSELGAAQTPQGFAFPLIHSLHEQHVGASFTDDAALAQAAGVSVVTVAGDRRNLKITDRGDLLMAHDLLPAISVVGQGFDVHRLEDGDGITLGGILVPCPFRLVGHSDADVALHALTDAILGGLGDGDIGTLFPPSDDRWKDADSAIFLEEACRRVGLRHGVIRHLDLTLICERPKIGPVREPMRERIAAIAGVAVNAVSVKATTTEGLGFPGRGEGIAAQASASLELPPGPAE